MPDYKALAEAYGEMVDKLLNHCSEPECYECSVIVCPHNCDLHLHHDGCPACYEESLEEYHEGIIKKFRRTK